MPLGPTPVPEKSFCKAGQETPSSGAGHGQTLGTPLTLRTRAFLSRDGVARPLYIVSVAGHRLFWKDVETVGRWVSPTEVIPRE